MWNGNTGRTGNLGLLGLLGCNIVYYLLRAVGPIIRSMSMFTINFMVYLMEWEQD
jgi:hypothetical protein